MSTTMTDEHGSTNGAHGGVGHLLRMAKTQCGVALAFAALRKPDGGFAIATFPALTADPSWSIEAIDELVRQTWEDPHLGGGTVLVRSGRVLKGMWTGQAHHIKLAAAALSDPEAPDHPWGLLCVAEPLAGHFEQDQLNLLGSLAVRLTSYLRARQQVLEGTYGFGPAAPPASPEPPYEPMVETPVVAVTEEAPPAAVAEEPEPATQSVAEELEVVSPEADQEQVAEPGWGELARAGDVEWEFLALDEVEWVEAVTTEPAFAEGEPAQAGQEASWQVEEPSVAAAEPAPEEAPTEAPVAEEAPTEAPVAEEAPEEAVTQAPAPEEAVTQAPAPEEAPEEAPTVAAYGTGGVTESPVAPSSELDAMLGPDPVTGLATLTTLVGRLGSALAQVRNNEGSVGLVLLEVSPAEGHGLLGPTALTTVSGRLSNHLRDRDLVARIGPSLFAVLVDLRPGSIELGTIATRVLGTLSAATETSTAGLQVRSAMAEVGPGATVSAEELLRQVADQLTRR